MKSFVEKYDTVTDPSGEGQAVRKQMTVQVEEWWNSSDVASSLREENTWGADGTVAVVGKRKKCVAAGGFRKRGRCRDDADQGDEQGWDFQRQVQT